MNKIKELLKKQIVRIILLAASGILTGLTVCFPSLGLFEWFSLLPAALVIYSVAEDEKHKLRSAYLYGLIFFMSYFLVNWHWLYSMYPMDFAGFEPLAAAALLTLGIVLISAIQSVSFAALFLLTVLFKNGKGLMKRFAFLTPTVAAALWALFEWSETLFWFGIPWGRLAIGQTKILITAQSASLFGSYFVAFIIVLVNFSAAYSLYYAEKRRLTAYTAAFVFLINALFGTVAVRIDRGDGERTVKAAVIQGNISSKDKWGIDWYVTTSESYGELSRLAAKDGAELIVFPESVFPVCIDDNATVMNYAVDLAKECHATLLFGTMMTADSEGGIKNVILTISPDGEVSETVYAKQKLVPFGEYVPWREFLTAIVPLLDDINMLDNGYVAGTDSVVAESNAGKIGSSICFDSIYEEVARKSALNGAEILAIETNDSWFSDSAAVYMHLAQGRLRAIENGKYVTRAANTGVSAIITPNGLILDEKDALQTGYCIANIRPVSEKTLYTYIGDSFVGICGSVTLAWIVAYILISVRMRKPGKKNDE